MTAPPRSAMVLAAGLGTRLRPITDTIPKPLVEIDGRPLIDHAINRLALAGVERLVVNVHYKAAMIAAHLASRDHPRIELSEEAELLDTGGGVARALPLLGETFFVVNSDVFWLDGKDLALLRLAGAFDPGTMDAVLVLQRTATAVGYEGAAITSSMSQEARAAAVRPRSHPIYSPAFSCCIGGCSTRHPAAFSRWCGSSTAPKRQAACVGSCMTASGTTSAPRRASP